MLGANYLGETYLGAPSGQAIVPAVPKGSRGTVSTVTVPGGLRGTVSPIAGV